MQVISSTAGDFEAPVSIAVSGANLWIANTGNTVSELSASNGSLIANV